MSGDRTRDLMSSETGGEAPLEALLPRRKLIVVIGIDEYAHIPRLRCAVSDALGVQQVLVERFGFEAPIPALINGAATKAAIETLVEDQLRETLEPDDALILFFAGHGTTRQTRLDATTVETGYLAPVEARGPDRFSDLLNMEELMRTIGLLPARHILVVIDACHSGMALGTAANQYRSPGRLVYRAMRNRTRKAITSAQRDELALDNGPIPGHSLFTGTLIQGLTSGEADMDGNGIITACELALYIQQKVCIASRDRPIPEYGSCHLDDRGEFVIAMNNVSQTPVGP